MKILEYTAPQKVLSTSAVLKKRKKQKISFIKYTKHPERVSLTEQGIKNLIKILKKKRPSNISLPVSFLVFFSASNAKADLSLFLTHAKNGFVNTIAETESFIYTVDHKLLAALLIWSVLGCFWILMKIIKR